MKIFFKSQGYENVNFITRKDDVVDLSIEMCIKADALFFAKIVPIGN